MRFFVWKAVACAVLVSSSVQADMGRMCQPRALTAEEKKAGEQVAAKLRKALPAAPPGWTMRDDRTEVASGSCQVDGRAVPQPVSVSLYRNFVRKDPPPAAAGPIAPQPPAAASQDPARQARIQELEKQVAEIQRKEKEAILAYQAARRAGDSQAQKEATDASRKYRAEMGPPQKELRELRSAERNERAAAGQASTRAAISRAQEARANRRDASVSVHTNVRQVPMDRARPVRLSGAPLAFRDAGGATHVLFGPWRQSGGFGLASIDESVPTTRMQAASVRIDANEATTEELLQALDLNAIKEALGASPVQTQVRRAPAQPQGEPVEIALQIGAKEYASTGRGECKAAPQASIYGVSAALYSVSHSQAGRSVNLTLWQPKNGSADMMSLHIADGASRYEVDTVKTGARRDTRGSGKTTLQKSGAGGVFTVSAVAASGEKISGTIKCPGFAAIRAEGG